MKIAALLILIITKSLLIKAQLVLPAIFTDNMIVQREKPLHVWGKSLPGKMVSINFNNQTTSALADTTGNWETAFKPMKAGGPYALSVSTDKEGSKILKNILIGDVWICAGQSNMNFILDAEKNGKRELNDLHNDSIREYRCEMPAGVENPENIDHSKWIPAMGEKARRFSAVAYYFAKKIQSEEHIPVGIIVMACGNTRAESWIDTSVLKLYPSLQPLLDHWKKRRLINDIEINHEPGVFYNSVVKPLLPLVIKGVIWYQGESNTLPDNSGRNINERAAEYKTLLTALINNWRNSFRQEQLPFYIIQLPNYKEPLQDLQWAIIRQAQLDVTRQMPHSALVVTIDVGDSTNIHPNNKQAVGERAAKLTLINEYHHHNVIASGPLAKNIKIYGDKIIISFDYTGSGLISTTGKGLTNFEVSDSNKPGLFFKANASIQKNKIVVNSADVSHPVAVRYAWADNPDVSLFNKEGLPASPFIINK